MFNRNITLCLIILCLASLFVGLPFAEAHPKTDEFTRKFKEAVRQRDNAYAQEEKWETHHSEAKAAIDTLLSEWKSNEESIKDNTWSFANTVAATVISMILDAVLTDDSGDGGATKTDWFKELVEALPAILAAINAAKTGSDLADDLSAREAYLLSLSTAVSALDEIISQNQAAFNVYESKYDKYVELMQNHFGGLVRDPNHNPSGDYNSVTAWSLETIKSTVKDKNAYNAVDSLNKLEFWYHVNDLKRTSHPSPHGFDIFRNFDDYWKLNPLPKNQACGGDCGQQHRTPVEHLVVCPHALTVSSLRGENGNIIVRNLPLDSGLPQGRAAPVGCNKAYYLCSSGDRDRHKIRICGKDVHGEGRCNRPYRNCTNPRFKHGRILSSEHKEKRSGLIIGPLGGLFNAAPGASHTAELTTPSAYTSVKWYVKSPSQTGRGTLVETDNGDGSSTTASLSYTFPSGVSGDYVITAVYANASTTEEASYTVSVSTSTTTPPPSQVDNSPNCDSCTTGGCSACPVVGACGHTYLPSERSSPTFSHAFQASCLETNEWGQTCTVAAFYACQTHTHQYPPLVKCGRGPCQDQVPWTTFHQKTCVEGHTYWSCNQTSVERHKSRGPCKRLIQRQVYNYQWRRNELVWQECGSYWTNCRVGARKCYTVNNQYRGDHTETAPPAPQPTPQ